MTLLCCSTLPTYADAPRMDMGAPQPSPPHPIPVREKTKKTARDGQDTHAGDDAKVKKPPKEPGADKRVDK